MLPEAQAHECGELVTQLSRPGAGPDPTATLGNLDSFPKMGGSQKGEQESCFEVWVPQTRTCVL